jgi:hypothetical protein
MAAAPRLATDNANIVMRHSVSNVRGETMRLFLLLTLLVTVGCASAAVREPRDYDTRTDRDKGLPSGVD